MESTQEKNAVVVVLGDVGRSPRMCYHALSLATHGFDVDLVGYLDTKPHERIAANPHIRLVGIPPPPDIFGFFRPLALAIKLVWLTIAAFYVVLFKTHCSAQLVIVQNPPGLPTLMIGYVASRVKSATFNIDWHNYTFTMLQTKYADGAATGGLLALIQAQAMTRLIALTHWWEGVWGRIANWNLCVSSAMRKDMNERWGIHALTLYDKAPSWIFRPISVEERYYFLIKMLSRTEFNSAVSRLASYARGDFVIDGDAQIFDKSETSIFSRRNPLTNEIELLASRPLLIVSSTSWSPDEDFSILFDALKEYERHAAERFKRILYKLESDDEELPNLLVVITGKGPLRDEYATKFARFQGPKVQVVLVWLAAEDYPKILASADLGISLHTSTSGLDLPMKVVDMFGCHLPVLAKNFRAIDELVKVDSNGALFDTPQDLKRSLMEVARGFPNNDKLKNWKAHFRSHLQAQSWEDQWDATFWPLVRDAMQKRSALTEEQRRWERYSATTPEEESKTQNA